MRRRTVFSIHSLIKDLEYWEVDELYLEQCCVQKYYQQRELLTWDHQVKKEEELEVFRPGRLGRLQKTLWDLFEKPHTSVGARVMYSHVRNSVDHNVVFVGGGNHLHYFHRVVHRGVDPQHSALL